jgi:cytoskeleton protein RodZ
VATGIGERLREARTASGVGLPEIEQRTKIRARYLRALEEEQWDLLPAEAYVRGFLRTYANFLGLDGAALADEYQRTHPHAEEEPAPRQIPDEQLRRRRFGLRAPRVARAPRAPRPSPAPPPPEEPRGRLPTPGTLAVVGVVGLLGFILLLGLLGDSEDEGGRQAGAEPATSEETTTETTTTEEAPSFVSVELTTTGTVWVCLVDAHDVPLIEGVTLTAGEKQGPFEARAFKIGLGNGQVKLTANDEPVPIPDAAEPIGYRITPEGTEELPSEARPTCV